MRIITDRLETIKRAMSCDISALCVKMLATNTSSSVNEELKQPSNRQMVKMMLDLELQAELHTLMNERRELAEQFA